jgi:hypothetical protein
MRLALRLLRTCRLWVGVTLFGVTLAAGAATGTDSLARTFAGMELQPGNDGVQPDPGPEYRAAVGAAWTAYQKRLGVPMARWAGSEIRHPGGGTVFYPFAGPDFATVGQLFPGADRYVLVAIQGARQPPDPSRLSDEQRGALFAQFVAEWKRFGALGFFRTNDLDADARKRVAGLGVTPILMAFAARLGYTVQDVLPIAYQEASGDYEPATAVESGGAWRSVRLVLSRDGRTSVLDYIRLDIADKHLTADPEQRRWIERLARNPVLLKAASHLPQRPHFSAIRDAIVAGAPLIVQDETGIDYDRLATLGEVSLYGRFVRPYRIFDRNSQQSLAAAYRAAPAIKDLDFSFSYIKSEDQRSLQIARRKAVTPEARRPDGRRG